MENEIEKLAAKAFPYVPNPDKDLATGRYNENMYSKRGGFHEGYKAALAAEQADNRLYFEAGYNYAMGANAPDFNEFDKDLKEFKNGS